MGVVGVKMVLKAPALLWAYKEQECRQRREKRTKQRALGTSRSREREALKKLIKGCRKVGAGGQEADGENVLPQQAG